jgi:hypothetical protein
LAMQPARFVGVGSGQDRFPRGGAIVQWKSSAVQSRDSRLRVRGDVSRPSPWEKR